MYELVKLSENDYYLKCSSRIGISKISENEVVIFDSSNKEESAVNLLSVLNEKGWKLKAIFETHSHSDHIMGNNYLCRMTGCKVYGYAIAPSMNKQLYILPAVFSGGDAVPNLKERFDRAANPYCEPLTKDVMPEGFEFFELYGHSYDQVCYKTKDGNIFCGDAIASKESLEKYPVYYLFDVHGFIDSLEKMRSIRGKFYVPSHCPHFDVSELDNLIDYNIAHVNKLSEIILGFCEEKIIFEELLKKVFDRFGIEMTDLQYFIISPTLRSYLTFLLKEGKIKYEFHDNRMYWVKK